MEHGDEAIQPPCMVFAKPCAPRTMNYGQIAAIYDADMGASMTLPDVDYYLQAARACGGPVLELGCGTGRILAALIAAGIDAVGIDRSAPMLAQARRRCGARARLLQMDMRSLAFDDAFALALLPYSLVTYLLDAADWAALATGLRRALRADARIVIDAFIPKAGLAGAGWMRDYARSVDGEWLVRHKRVQREASGCHRIERRYRLRGAFGGRTLVTEESIRPYTPAQLIDLAERQLGAVCAVDHDYMPGRAADGARFCTITARCRG
jgi:SAM-dependent methyltransferase